MLKFVYESPLTKAYYKEALYVVTFYKKFLNNPKMKVKSITTNYVLLLLSSLVVAFLGIIFFNENEMLRYVIISLMGMTGSMSVALIIKFNLSVNLMINTFKKKEFIIDENKIEYKDDSKVLSTNIDSIKYIKFTKLGIYFIGDNNTLFSLPSSEKNKIEEFFKSINKEELIIKGE